MCRYVVEKDTKNNVVFVSRNYYSIDKRRRIFRVGSLRWLSGKPSGNVSELRCKVNNMINYFLNMIVYLALIRVERLL